MLPSLQELEQVGGIIKSIPNKQGEFLRKIHYGCYLLCSEGGLRISEAVKFDLNAKTRKGLYRIEKTKGKKERLVYISPQVVSELKKHNWQPNQTNRFAFYHFLQKIKREVNISPKIELTPHTFRRAFTTYHANSGMPLPLLQKLLGHSSIRTTASYWRNIYSDNDNRDDDTADILASKKWLENREKEPPKSPPTKNFPKTTKKYEPIIRDKPTITTEKPVQQEWSLDNFNKLSDNSLLTTEKEKNLAITNYQPQPLIRQISPKTPEKFFLNTSEKLPVITNQEERPTNKEEFLLTRIKQLEEQLVQVQTENSNLKLENKHLKALIQQDERTEAKVIQPLFLKPNK